MGGLVFPMDRLRYIVPIFALAALGCAIWARTTETFPGDVSITQAFQENRTSWLDQVMLIFTSLGNIEIVYLILLLAGLLLYTQSKRLHTLALAMAGLGSVLVPVIKNVVERPRPLPGEVEVFQSLSSYSFPSGHAFTSMIAFGAMFYFADHLSGHNRWMTRVLRSILAVVVLGVGASRIYLGLHWASDVLAGYLMGGLTLIAVIALFNWLHKRRETSPV